MNTAENPITDNTVVVQLDYKDGSTVTIPEAELQFANIKGILACTYSFANGDCHITASTCDAARAGFCSCAAAIGHPRACGPRHDLSD